MIGAATALAPIQVTGLPLNNLSIKSAAAGDGLPRLRMILVGESSLEYLNDLVRDTSSLIPSWRPQDILYLDQYGGLVICPSSINSSRVHPPQSSWKICDQAINDLSEVAYWFQRSEAAITQFIGNSDWLFIVTALDNPMAFVASEKIAAIARDAGVMSVAIVGTPYARPIRFSHGDALGSASLNEATMRVVERMSEICQCTIPDNGGLNRNSNYIDGYEWSFYGSELALHMISEWAAKKDVVARMGNALSTAGVCMVGFGIDENLHAAIEEAITYSGPCEWWGDTHITSTGAIFRIIGDQDRVSRMKEALLQELREPSKFLHYGTPFWLDGANFHIVTSSPDYMRDEDYCSIHVLSMGVALV